MKHLLNAACIFLSAALSYSQIGPAPVMKRNGGPVPPRNIDPNAPTLIGKGSISGMVVNSKTHEPVKKASVMINGNASLSAITDAGGTFSFRSLPAGAYWVMANHQDFASAPRRSQMAVNVALADGEEKTGIEIRLQPSAGISGKVIDEDDRPVTGCSVSAKRVNLKQSMQGFTGSIGSATDSEGNYRIHGIPAGRYVVRAQCNQSFPAPHGFMRSNDPDTPTEGFAPVTYGGAANAASSGLLLEPGAELGGIDFHVRRSRMFSVRATVAGVDASTLPSVQLFMIPHDEQQDDDIGMPARFNGRRGVFIFRNVAAGSYEIAATVFNGEKGYEARQDVQVGISQVTEVELKMNPGPGVSGSVVSDDPNIQLEGQRIALQPLKQNYRGPFPAADIAKDGTFDFKFVLPGRFSMNGLHGGFFKSVTLGGREITPSDFEITGEGAGVMRISLSSRFAKVHVNAESQPAVGEQVAVALLPVPGGQPILSFFSGTGAMNVEFNTVPPGKYRVLLVSSENPGIIFNDPSSLKTLEDRMAQITVAEASDQHVTATIVGKDELGKLLESSE